MVVDSENSSVAPASPNGGIAAPPPARTPRRWTPAQPKKLPTALIISFVVIATGVVLGLTVVLSKIAQPNISNNGPKLAKEISDTKNSYTIQPPINWQIEDLHDGSNIYIKGPREKGFSPLIIVSLDIKPGAMASYLQQHKGRIGFQDKSVKWLSEETDESIDGCVNTARLEYDCDLPVDPDDSTKGTVKVRTLQYIMEDKPRYYRVTCHVALEHYERYLPRFEACARSFKRIPLPRQQVTPIN
jgi:hypothetical protein